MMNNHNVVAMSTNECLPIIEFDDKDDNSEYDPYTPDLLPRCESESDDDDSDSEYEYDDDSFLMNLLMKRVRLMMQFTTLPQEVYHMVLILWKGHLRRIG